MGRDTLKELHWALKDIKWRSLDKDNMEFGMETTYSVVDRIRKFVTEWEADHANS